MILEIFPGAHFEKADPRISKILERKAKQGEFVFIDLK
jgi:hypothetical protein